MILRKISLYKTKAAVSLRDFGIRHTLLGIFEYALLNKVFLFRQYIIYEKQLSQLDHPGLRNLNLEFLFISPDDKELLDQIEQLSGLSRELVSEKIINGGECIVAADNGRLAGFNLVSTGKAHLRHLDGYLSLSKSEAWSEQITVSPQLRQSGLATDMRHLMFDRLAKKGYAKLLGGYAPFNVKSGLLAKKLGFIEREKVTLVKILKWKKFFIKKLSPAANGLLSISGK